MSDYNAAERKDVRKAEKLAKHADEQRREIISGIMSVSPGRGWMHDLLVSCHIFSSSFSDDPCRTAFGEGERNIGLRLLGDIMRACPDQYVEMMREANERDTAITRGRSKDRDGGDQGPSTAPVDGDDDATTFYDGGPRED